MTGTDATLPEWAGKISRSDAPYSTVYHNLRGFILGMHPKAVKETAIFFVLLTVLSLLTSYSANFYELLLHPYWIIVLLMAAQYGLRESLFAAGIATAFLLIGPMPEQMLSETLYGYWMRMLTTPALWGMSALVLGGIRAQQDFYRLTLEEKAHHNETAAHTIRNAYERLKRRKETLEFRLAAQHETASGMQSVVNTLFQEVEDEVFLRLPEAIRHWLQADSVSVYRRGEEGLQLVASLGWAPDARYTREFVSESALFHTICKENRSLSFLKEEEAALLKEDGMLATPLIDAHGGCLGMLKVESLPLDLLTPQLEENLRQLGQWAGTAIGRHRLRLESDKKSPSLRVIPQTVSASA